MRRALLGLLVFSWVVGCEGASSPPGDGGEERPDGSSLGDGGSRADAAMGDGGGAPDSGPALPECALPVPFDVGVSYERTLHVATDGDDGADGSAAAPLRTLRAAADRATPGTRILLAAGTYLGSTFLRDVQGEPGRPIAIVGEGEVILDADGALEALHVSDPRYLVLENVTVQNARGNGINIDDGGSYSTPAEHVVLRKITVRDVGSGGNNDCIKLSGLDRFFILDSDISGCDDGDGIDMVGCHHGVISGNRIHDTFDGGIQAKGGSADTIIHGNLFVGVPGRSINAGGSTGLEYFRPIDAPYEAARLRVVGNVFVRSGPASGAPIAFVGCDACVFANNTVIEPQTWVARILQETTGARFVPSRDGVFANNLVVFGVDTVRSIVNVGANTAPETFSFANNLWWALDRDASWTGPNINPAIPAETGSIIQQDPALLDLGGGDYRLGASSPAIGAGRPIEGPAYPDFDGRCYGQPPAIGAFAAP